MCLDYTVPTLKPLHLNFNFRGNYISEMPNVSMQPCFVKMCGFVTLCGRDRIPIILFQDTTGVDVGDVAEKLVLWTKLFP